MGETPVFLPKNMMESARKQRGLAPHRVPAGCVLDFDGEIVEHLISAGRAQLDRDWPCFHTRLYRCTSAAGEFGIVGGSVGAPFAVLIAEELFATGCEALVSIGSAGLLATGHEPPFFVMIDRAVRDEGTSYHYLTPAAYVETDRQALTLVQAALEQAGIHVLRETTWTTDAPFRETPSRIAAYRDQGVLAVEMEAAALLSFAVASRRRVMCFSHVTNQMATNPGDFEKGGSDGHEQSVRLCEEALRSLLEMDRSKPAK
ncbi:MAG: nucleoside phosphorylase [bacterium]|nr:nucleoside phosphorylase [bacterium]